MPYMWWSQLRSSMTQAWSWWDRSQFMTSHRRYAAAAGDVLSGSITYALLLAILPVLLLSVAVLSFLIPVVDSSAVPGLLLTFLPAGASELANMLEQVRAPATVLGLVALVWTVLTMLRAIRSGIRTLWGQPNGSGKPPLDYASDALVGAVLLAVISVVAWTTAAAVNANWTGGVVPAAWLSHLGTFIALTVVLGLSYMLLPFKDKAVPVWARWRAALFGAVAVEMVKFAATWYASALEGQHQTVYGILAVLVGALVLLNVAVRLVLRVLSFELSLWLPPLPDRPLPGREKRQ